jgi:hypothetical protein
MTLTAKQYYAASPETVGALRESEFYSRLKMSNGTFKMTRPARFDAFEANFGPAIGARRERIRRVLDVGVSTGVTTLEFSKFLRGLQIDARITATDLYIDAALMDAAPGVRILSDAEGWPLQYDVFGIPVRPWIRRLDYVTLAALPLTLARLLAHRRAKALIARGAAQPVRMLTRETAETDRVEFIENDVFAPTPSLERRFHLVRAANILNLTYFPAERIAVALGNLRRYMAGPGSMLWISRNGVNGGESGTLFELRGDGRFEVLSRAGEGSEIESLVLGMAEVAPARPAAQQLHLVPRGEAIDRKPVLHSVPGQLADTA